MPNKDGFVRNIGAGRAFSGSVSIGGGGNWTTADFIVWLESQGAFNHPYWMCKGSWAYADNRIITDTGCGNIQLAGAVVEVMGVRGAMTIRVTTASSGAGTLNAQFTYCNHGEGYPAPWRRDLNRSGDDITGDLSLQNLHTRGVIKSDGEIQTTSANAYRIVYGDYGVFWHQNGNDLYLMLTNRGDPYGAFNDLRPFVVNLTTGKVSITNGATIHGLRVESSIAIGTDNALGANAIVLGDSDTGFKQNGDGILDVYANNAHVFRFTTGVNNSIQALRSESYISAKGGVYEFNGSQDVRVYSPHNPPPAVDLSPYATMGWVLQNFVQNIRVSAAVGRDFRDGWGYSANDAAFATAISMVGGSSNVGSLLVRYVQKLINNTWYNITE
ncbi:MAG: phage tail protein [Hafnia sp.]